MTSSENPALFQAPARVWLRRLGLSAAGNQSGPGRERSITLRDIPDGELDRLAELGFSWLYLLGVWQTGQMGLQLARTLPYMQPAYHAALSDFDESDVAGSPFAVQDYRVHVDFGGAEALAVLRDKLRARGIRLMLDFVPNHTALDHSWVQTAPQRYVQANEAVLANRPADFIRLDGRVFAHGRDPYFPGWTDTLQLDYSQRDTQEAMVEQLGAIAHQCDGVRCDMAMLLLPDVFEHTWQRTPAPFWPWATEAVRRRHPDFVFMAEVYWNREWELQQQGFDYTYDKVLCDRLVSRDVEAVRGHLGAALDFQTHSARFLENHDEPRIASELSWPEHRAAATIAYSIPGLRFLHDGQMQGMHRKPVIQLSRREQETPDPEVEQFYHLLLKHAGSEASGGAWRLLPVRQAWDGNWTAPCCLVSTWSRENAIHTLIAVNYSGHKSQCYAPLDDPRLRDRIVILEDRFSDQHYERDGNTLLADGLYLDLDPWQAQWFALSLLP